MSTVAVCMTVYSCCVWLMWGETEKEQRSLESILNKDIFCQHILGFALSSLFVCNTLPRVSD